MYKSASDFSLNANVMMLHVTIRADNINDSFRSIYKVLHPMSPMRGTCIHVSRRYIIIAVSKKLQPH